MRLSELLEEQGMDARALKDLDITGLTADSRAVKPGYLFAALPGLKDDGRSYIADAVERGACAVLAPPGTDLGAERADARGNVIRLITDSNPRRRFALMAARYFGAQPEIVAAVTGTNGKTSTAHFAQQLWTHLGHKAGYLGTLGAFGPGLTVEGSLTTPDPVRLHALLADMAKNGATRAAMEASSHGLHQFRVDGVKISIGGFTTFTRDHLDYHGSMAAYLAAKMRLFSDVMVAGGIAVLNADTPEFNALEASCRLRGHRVMGYGKQGDALRLVGVSVEGDAQVLDLVVLEKSYRVRLPLAGSFQVGNAVCALGFVLASGADPRSAVAALECLTGVPGRMQRVGFHKSGAPVYVDYAHTPDALETALLALRPHAARNLVVVFGCGGDRDRGKRRIMGDIAQRLANDVIVTDDNPRTEDAAAIRAEVMQGCPNAKNIGDRAEAIAMAVSALKAGDVLLLAGKGHETGQITGTTVIPFSDVDEAKRALGLGGAAS
ncbi:MAG: UDP-N-acetylmuramoyl-L-alanyl-D-glutamate--2,6-diaminopimelate ligase [Rhodospirillaceae bacterium]